MLSTMQTNLFTTPTDINETVLAETQQVLTYAPTSLTATSYNDTWIYCDGTDDYLNVSDYDSLSVSFWYNSSTSGTWQHVVNNSVTTYVNGSEATPDEYPVYYDGDYYYFCKTDASTFWEGMIDEVKLYNTILNSTEVSDIYSDGR